MGSMQRSRVLIMSYAVLVLCDTLVPIVVIVFSKYVVFNGSSQRRTPTHEELRLAMQSAD